MRLANNLILFIYVSLCLGQEELSKEKERRSLDDYHDVYGYYYEDAPEEPSPGPEEPSPGPELDLSYCAKNCQMRYAPPEEYHDTRIDHLLVGDGVNIYNYQTAFNDQEGHLIDLGETITTEHYDWEDSERIVEQTSLAQGTFISDKSGEIIFGSFQHSWILPIRNENGDLELIKLWTKSEVYKDSIGRLVRSIYPAHEILNSQGSGHANADVQTFGKLESEDSEVEILEDAIVGSWMSGLNNLGRRKLWLQSLEKRPSRRRLGRQLEEDGQQHVEIHVAFHYTSEALFWSIDGLQQMKDKAFYAISEGNLALHNSGVPDLAFIMHQEFLEADHGGDWRAWAMAMSESDRSVADINILIMSNTKEMNGIVGEAFMIPIIDGDGYEHETAFARIGDKSLSSLTLTHELGHLLGLGHNAGTKDCKPKDFSQCGHVIKCGDGGYRTVMAYDSIDIVERKVKGGGKRWFACDEGTEGEEIRVKHFSNPALDYIYDGKNYGSTGTRKANTVAQIHEAMNHVPYYVSPDIDCEGTWGPCKFTADETECYRDFTQTMLKRGNGADCPPEPDCAPGEDECPHPQDCVGHWSACTEQCEVAADREFIITTHPNIHGDPCPNSGEDCIPGEDLCPPFYAVAKVGTTSYRGPYNGCLESSATGGCITRLKDPIHSHLAVCCSENPIRNWRRFPGCEVFAPIHSNCFAMNWEHADQYCKSQGARLCSADELETNCAMVACGGTDSGKLAWSISTVLAEKPQPPELQAPLSVTGSPKYCVARGDPHFTAPWRRHLNRFDDDTIGEIDFFRINGLRIVNVQDVGSVNQKATVHEVKIFYKHVMATISVSKLDIPAPIVFSHMKNSHWPSYRWWKYQITFPDVPELVFGWNHWINSWWGAQLGIGVRYSGSWSTVGGQCGDPNNPGAQDCDDCNPGHPEEMNMNPPTCKNLKTCCSFFDDDDFMKAACLLDHFEMCCEDGSDETCCDDMKPPLCPHDMQCDPNEVCNMETGECIEKKFDGRRN